MKSNKKIEEMFNNLLVCNPEAVLDYDVTTFSTTWHLNRQGKFVCAGSSLSLGDQVLIAETDDQTNLSPWHL